MSISSHYSRTQAPTRRPEATPQDSPLADVFSQGLETGIYAPKWDPRGETIARRTYNRELAPGVFETWNDTIDRVCRHQFWLWTGADTRCPETAEAVFQNPGESFRDTLTRVDAPPAMQNELIAIRDLMNARAALPAGRTLWLGGTEVSRTRESSQFNCSWLELDTVHDLVDAFWLLLQGAGVGFSPRVGNLHGFATYIPKLTIVPSAGHTDGGCDENVESFDHDAKVWTIKVGDSAEAWAKAAGKLVAGKYHGCKVLVLDFSEVRAPGSTIKGYGWQCQGYEPLAKALQKVFHIMNRRAGEMLEFGDIHDCMNLLGTCLSSRRSAQIALCEYGAPNWRKFAEFKNGYYLPNIARTWREQSNNTLEFHQQPTREQLEEIFSIMAACGGSEPGFRNAAAAKQRAPYSRGTNPCGEILLGGLCNLVEINVAHPHHEDFDNLLETLYLLARANYRQANVNLNDGILQRKWHEQNEMLKLCGVGITGLVERNDLLNADTLEIMKHQARAGAFSMADELELPRPKAVTTVKPSGTLSKVMGCTEGMHRPLGKYIFNAVEFGATSPLVTKLAEAGYRVKDHPTKADTVLVTFPASFENVDFDTLPDGREGNLESAVSQLERYRMLVKHWADHNVSCTISYAPDEVPEIISWLEAHWDEVIGVSFLYRADPQARAEELGYAYLPQEVVTEEEYLDYVAELRDFELDDTDTDGDPTDEECATGACPVK